MIRFKVCCIQNVDEMRLAVRYGASAIGLVSAMPSGPGVVSDETAALVARSVPPGVDSFLLTSLQTPKGVIEQQRRIGCSILQLVDAFPVSGYADLRAALPGVRIVQVIHVQHAGSVEEAVAVSSQVDGLLLDSGTPNAAVKVLGGTGRVHDWSLSREICSRVSIPVYLAGGLKTGNVAEAFTSVRPFALDVCSGLRIEGLLSESRLDEFVGALQSIPA